MEILDDSFILEGGGKAWISRKIHAAAKKAYRDFCLEIAEKTGGF